MSRYGEKGDECMEMESDGGKEERRGQKALERDVRRRRKWEI